MGRIDVERRIKHFNMRRTLSVAMLAMAGLVFAESTQAKKPVLDRVVVRGDRGSWGWGFLWDFGIYYAYGIRELDYYLEFPDLGEYGSDYE